MPVPRYAAFLRGINLGSRRRVDSATLRSLFEGLGLQDVDPFRTSGNLAFGAPRGPQSKLGTRIERGLADALGYEVVVFLRTAAEVRAMAGHQPFAANVVQGSHGKLQVLMLPARPAASKRAQVLRLATDEDRLAFGPRELYWLPSGGTMKAALDLKAIEKLLGPGTMRTKGTVDQMAAKYFPG